MQMPIRPSESINKIICALEPLGTVVDVPAKKRLSWEYNGVPYVYLFLSGELSVSRIADGILIATVSEPHAFGFSEMFGGLRNNYLKVELESRLMQLNSKEAEIAIQEQGLWKDVASVLAYHTNMMVYRDAQIVNQRTFPMICHYLRELDLLPEEAKARINILNYIQGRTGLSRSSVLNVISELKNEGRIEFARGGYKLRIIKLPG